MQKKNESSADRGLKDKGLDKGLKPLGRGRASLSGEVLEELYRKYNRREFVYPDPLIFLYDYENPADREIAGIIASGLAYGNVKQILASVSKVLTEMGPAPRDFLDNTSEAELKRIYRGFKHRWTTGDDVASLLAGVKSAVTEHGSLRACFAACMNGDRGDVLSALDKYVAEINSASGDGCGILPIPSRGSACKRLLLYLRWMVREDDVDPGGWSEVSPRNLIVPLDRHMYSISRALGITSRNQADMKTALEITDFFRRLAPEDPVRYDFALTRLGIRDDTDAAEFIARCS